MGLRSDLSKGNYMVLPYAVTKKESWRCIIGKDGSDIGVNGKCS